MGTSHPELKSFATQFTVKRREDASGLPLFGLLAKSPPPVTLRQWPACRVGVSPETARIDAEGIEHHVSGETLEAFRRFIPRKN